MAGGADGRAEASRRNAVLAPVAAQAAEEAGQEAEGEGDNGGDRATNHAECVCYRVHFLRVSTLPWVKRGTRVSARETHVSVPI